MEKMKIIIFSTKIVFLSTFLVVASIARYNPPPACFMESFLFPDKSLDLTLNVLPKDENSVRILHRVGNIF